MIAVASPVAAHPQGPRQRPSSHSDPVSGPAAAATAERRLHALHEMHSKPLLSYLVKLTLGDTRRAEDILQETFIRAWCHLKQHDDTDLERFRPWLYTVARRLVVDMLRARRSRPAEVIVDDIARLPGSEDTIGSLLRAQAVRDALMRLQPEQRTMLIELYHHGRTPSEVAQRLNIPEGTVKSRTFYAKRALRSYLAQ